MNKTLRKFVTLPLVALFWLGVWAGVAWAVDKPLLLPYPWQVLARLGELLGTAEFYLATLHSIRNVLAGILLALVLGVLLSALTHRLPFLRSLLLPLMTVIKTTPIVSFIILAILWIGSAAVPSFITVLIVLPIVWTNLDTALSRVDPQLIEMTRVYQLPPLSRLWHLTIPSVMPYFLSACRASVGLAWKAGIAAEVIAVPLATIGAMLSDAKQYLEAVDLFAWTLVVILLSLLFEWGLSALLSRIPASPEGKEA